MSAPEPPAAAEAVAARSTRLLNSIWVEFGTLLFLASCYVVIRADSTDHNKVIASDHARRIADAEGWIFHQLELSLNHWLVGVTWLAVAACYFYALMHFMMTPLVLFLSRRLGGWQYWRGYWSLVVVCAIALVLYANFPVAPPRLMPDLGAVDVMREFSRWGWWEGAASAPRGLGDATNQYAAMPSLHFGWSLWCGIQMWGFGSRRWRVAAVAYPTVQALVVIATANHFGLDVVAGGVCVITAYLIVAGVRQAAIRLRAASERPLATAAAEADESAAA